MQDAASAPESNKQRAKKSFKGAHAERRTRDAEGVEFEAPRVETPKASRGCGMGTGYPLPSRLGGLWKRRKLTRRSGVRARAPAKNDFYRAMLCIRGTSHGPVSVSVSVTSRSSTKTDERIELVLGTRASFHPSYTVLTGNSVISKKWHFPLELCPKLLT